MLITPSKVITRPFKMNLPLLIRLTPISSMIMLLLSLTRNSNKDSLESTKVESSKTPASTALQAAANSALPQKLSPRLISKKKKKKKSEIRINENH